MTESRARELYQTCLQPLELGWLGHLLPMYFLFLRDRSYESHKMLRVRYMIPTFMKVHISISLCQVSTRHDMLRRVMNVHSLWRNAQVA